MSRSDYAIKLSKVVEGLREKAQAEEE